MNDFPDTRRWSFASDTQAYWAGDTPFWTVMPRKRLRRSQDWVARETGAQILLIYILYEALH